jgi:hypothetical protein
MEADEVRAALRAGVEFTNRDQSEVKLRKGAK